MLRPALILLRRLAAATRGVAAVEFALIAPVVITLVIGTIEIAHLLTVQVSLDGAVAEAARIVSVHLDDTEDKREQVLREHIIDRMSAFPIADDGKVEITTTVYRTFGSSYPEAYEDTNGNGRYDPPSGKFPGESFDDRNKNGVRDLASPTTGKMGNPGDVVSYTAVFPAAFYFDFFSTIIGKQSLTFKATTVLRNEPVRRGAVGT